MALCVLHLLCELYMDIQPLAYTPTPKYSLGIPVMLRVTTWTGIPTALQVCQASHTGRNRRLHYWMATNNPYEIAGHGGMGSPQTCNIVFMDNVCHVPQCGSGLTLRGASAAPCDLSWIHKPLCSKQILQKMAGQCRHPGSFVRHAVIEDE